MRDGVWGSIFIEQWQWDGVRLLQDVAMESASNKATSRGDWREDLSQLCRQLPGKAEFGLLAAGWFALFHWLGNSTFGYVATPSLFGWMLNAYKGSDDDAIGFLMPVVVLALLWIKREKLLECKKAAWPPGLFLVGLGLALHLFGYAAQQPRISIIGFFAGFYGLMGLVWGREWLRAIWFPYFLLIFCMPFSALTEGLAFKLRMVATVLTAGIAREVLGIEVVRDGTVLMDPSGQFHYEVAAACSGLRSLVSIGTVSVILAFLQLRKSWRRIVLILSAIPLAVVCNVFRLMIIILAAKLFGQEAGNWVHNSGLFSLLPYVPAFAGLALLLHLLRENKQPKAGAPAVPAVESREASQP